ncbi:putative phosphoserine phosphatase 2 [Streptomyces sp. RB5]|uniref:Putative phosphoserine phosphatase 2 n=1 Tax=Streptomyces smaragdinus TaxID=2585196 RepID=A0A7K0CH73_9ACTN|nr:histidine phosphatase family protein [Streptomyces smaragdinus]MQY12808.1 putative phosphoserine phosphatase 2 [Streptomyces smaragdinus]
MTTLFLARHGETVWHTSGRYAGISDIDLTDLGLAQAEALGTWAGKAELDAVWSSPLSRARATAAPAARAAGVELRTDADLTELDFGTLEGRTLAQVAAEDPDAVTAFEADPVANPVPGEEDPRAAMRRGTAALWRITHAHPGQRVLVVWHGTLMRLVLSDLLHMPPGDYRRVFPDMRNGALTELRMVEPGRVSLLSFNSRTMPF